MSAQIFAKFVLLPATRNSYTNGLPAKFKPFVSAALIGIACLVAGCTSTPFSNTQSSAVDSSLKSPALPAKIVKITAVGYGASSSYDGYTLGQKRLMAMRASKLDAYRALAEEMYGVRVNGNSTVSAMMSQVDSFRVYVDTYLRGAQVVSVTPMADGNYETTMELSLDDRFFNTFAHQVKPTGNLTTMQQTSLVDSGNIRGAVGPGFAYGSNFYYSE